MVLICMSLMITDELVGRFCVLWGKMSVQILSPRFNRLFLCFVLFFAIGLFEFFLHFGY